MYLDLDLKNFLQFVYYHYIRMILLAWLKEMQYIVVVVFPVLEIFDFGQRKGT